MRNATLPRTTARDEQSPTVETAVVVVGAFLVQFPLSLLGLWGLFVLQPAFLLAPWTIVTSVYAHASVGHLVGNLVGLAVFGWLVERTTTRLRFHAFFVAAGALAGLSEVTLGSVLSLSPRAVLGASGAIFALMGYAIIGNRLAGWALEAVEAATDAEWAGTAVLILVAALLAVVLSGPGSAVVAHATGLAIGLFAGRLRLLHVTRSDGDSASMPAD